MGTFSFPFKLGRLSGSGAGRRWPLVAALLAAAACSSTPIPPAASASGSDFCLFPRGCYYTNCPCTAGPEGLNNCRYIPGGQPDMALPALSDPGIVCLPGDGGADVQCVLPETVCAPQGVACEGYCVPQGQSCGAVDASGTSPSRCQLATDVCCSMVDGGLDAGVPDLGEADAAPRG